MFRRAPIMLSLYLSFLVTAAPVVEVLTFNTQEVEPPHKQEVQQADLNSERWTMLFNEMSETNHSIELLRAKIDTLEKQQRDFLALMTDLVIQPQKGMAFQEQRDYEEGLELMKVQQYAQAIKLFNKLLQQYPQSDKLPYVHYWIAEIHTVQKRMAEARLCYQYLYEHYPRHPKASEALFKIGKIDYNEGLIADAEAAWSEVVIQYPQSQSAQLAKKSLKILYDEKNAPNLSENY